MKTGLNATDFEFDDDFERRRRKRERREEGEEEEEEEGGEDRNFVLFVRSRFKGRP